MVDVTVRNIGKVAACPSSLRVTFGQNLVVDASVHVPVPHLKPRHATTIVVYVPNVTGTAPRLKLKGLDPLAVVADVNYDHHVPELNLSNNLDYARPDTPVIARFWRVTTWSAHLVSTKNGATTDCTAHTTGTSEFGYPTYDSAYNTFDYELVAATLDETCSITYADTSGSQCTGSGTGNVYHNPWPTTSHLLINYAEDRYGATLDPIPGETFPDTITCPSGSGDGTLSFSSLQTGPPLPRSAAVGARTFKSSGTITAPGVSITNTWQLDAAVP